MQRRDLLDSEKGLQLTKINNPPSLAICVDMEQFVLVPVSVFNKTLKIQSVTRQELPSVKLNKEKNKLFFAKADCFVDKILSRSRIKLSYSHTLILDGVVEIGVLLSNFA